MQDRLFNFSKSYLDILNSDFSGLNLTRINNIEDFWNKQILDSILPVVNSNTFLNSIIKTKKVIDIGFGGGFPLLVLAFYFPNIRFIGVESLSKKVNAVREIAKSLKLHNVELIHSNLKNLEIKSQSTITFKAVGKIVNYLPMINSRKDCDVFFYKGLSFEELEGLEIENFLNENNSWKNHCGKNKTKIL
jgi:16S rRNA (guanine527-N7)-methyltransferase